MRNRYCVKKQMDGYTIKRKAFGNIKTKNKIDKQKAAKLEKVTEFFVYLIFIRNFEQKKILIVINLPVKLMATNKSIMSTQKQKSKINSKCKQNAKIFFCYQFFIFLFCTMNYSLIKCKQYYLDEISR